MVLDTDGGSEYTVGKFFRCGVCLCGRYPIHGWGGNWRWTMWLFEPWEDSNLQVEPRSLEEVRDCVGAVSWLWPGGREKTGSTGELLDLGCDLGPSTMQLVRHQG